MGLGSVPGVECVLRSLEHWKRHPSATAPTQKPGEDFGSQVPTMIVHGESVGACSEQVLTRISGPAIARPHSTNSEAKEVPALRPGNVFSRTFNSGISKMICSITSYCLASRFTVICNRCCP